MKNTLFGEIVTALTPAELKRFDEFMHARYFTRGKNIIRLWEEVYAYAPAFTFTDAQKEKMYCTACKVKTFSETNYRNFLSDMYQLSKEFLAIENLIQNTLQFQQLLTDALIEKSSLHMQKNKQKKFQNIFRQKPYTQTVKAK